MQDTPQTPAGWYPQGNQQRYWDGQQWTEHFAAAAVPPPPDTLKNGTSSDDRTMALVAYIIGYLVSFLGPLIIYLIKKDESPFVRRHCAEILNHIITATIATIGFAVMIVVGVIIATATATLGVIIIVVAGLGLVTMVIVSMVWSVMGAIAANDGLDYRYPISIRLIN
jgi:uncharacterized Tic20 family protein